MVNYATFLNIVILYYLLMRRDVWLANHLVVFVFVFFCGGGGGNIKFCSPLTKKLKLYGQLVLYQTSDSTRGGE